MQVHAYSIEVEGSPEEVWGVFWAQRSGTVTHGEVTIEVLHPGDQTGEGLVRHCTFPVPKWLLSGGRAVSWEWLTEVHPHRSWRYDAVGKPLWSTATGLTRLQDLGGGRTRVDFRETYHAFNPVLRALFERRVHRAISGSNDATLATSITTGVRMLRRAQAGRDQTGRDQATSSPSTPARVAGQ
ncbi:MAG: polyketide cyclase / dehydrase and lipid transport family protein [Acidimicrobiales bacterium]